MSHSQQLREAIDTDAGAWGTCKRSLLSVIDQQIIPQLAGVHEDADTPSAHGPTPDLPFDPDAVRAFARLCCEGDDQAGRDFVAALLDRGHALPDVLQQVVAPAARCLGEWWDQDQIGFQDVSLGLVRMQNITHHFTPMQRRPTRQEEDRFHVMVAAAPGSRHLLGLAMVQELFANDGWDVRVELATDDSSLRQALAGDWFDVLGLSVGLTEHLPGLPALIADLRRHSLNPRLGVLLGGAAFAGMPASAPAMGADAICLEPMLAIRAARRLAMQVRAGPHDHR